MRGLEADEDEDGRIGFGYETCDVSDFYISDMIITSLPMDGDAFSGDISGISRISDYKPAESTMFDAADQYMVLPALEDDAKSDNTSNIRSCEEVIMVPENVSLYSAIGQIRSCNQGSDLIIDSYKAESFDPQSFIKNLPELSDIESDSKLGVTTKASQRRKSVTLVLDLDGKKLSMFPEIIDDLIFNIEFF